MPRLKESDLEKAARNCKATTGVGCDGFHLRCCPPCWWVGLRALEVSKWQQEYHVRRGATDGRNGGAERTVWETSLEMESFDHRAAEKDQSASALVLDLAKAFQRVSLPVVWAWATHFRVTIKTLRVLCGYF